jgi:pimeloyl-ACP methyl ester carboxylesterase
MGTVPAEIRNAHGERLDATFHEGAPGRRDLVVIGHGVTANKDRPFLVALSEGLAAAGIASLRFSFSGNGGSEGRFEDATVRKEVGDLGAVLDRLDGWRVVYAGHSMGGAVGLWRASEDPRIRALVSLAGMVHCQDFALRKFGAQQPGASCMWDKPDCPLSQAYMDDMAAIGTLVERAGLVRVPWLLVHGTEDTVVPLRDATDALARAGAGATLVRLEGADHVFSGDATPRMVDTVVPWLK